MITPDEIQGRTFKNGLGYEKKDVDQFISEISADYESLYKTNAELNDRLKVLNEGVQYYKTIEKTLQRALVLAEKTADNTKAAAKQEYSRLLKEAKLHANSILLEAQEELNTIQAKTAGLIQQYELYKAQFKNLALTQIDLLESEGFKLNQKALSINTASDLGEDSEIDEDNINEELLDKLDEPSDFDIINIDEN